MSKMRRKSERVMWEAFVDFIWNDPEVVFMSVNFCVCQFENETSLI